MQLRGRVSRLGYGWVRARMFVGGAGVEIDYRSKYRYGVEFAAESFCFQEWGGSFSITEEVESKCHMLSEQATSV